MLQVATAFTSYDVIVTENQVRIISILLARDVIYTSRAYATMSVSICLSICL